MPETIAKWYDGCRFGLTEIYNPWSVLNCIDSYLQNDMVADLAICQPQHTMQDQNALRPFRHDWQKAVGHQLAPDMQGRSHKTVNRTLSLGYSSTVQSLSISCCDKATELEFPGSAGGTKSRRWVLASLRMNGFAESVKPAAFSITIRSVLHLLTPDPRENEKPAPVAAAPCVYVAAAASARIRKTAG